LPPKPHGESRRCDALQLRISLAFKRLPESSFGIADYRCHLHNDPVAQPTILVVDDSELIRVMLSDLLRLWGYNPVTAPDGALALRLAETGEVDAVFTDLQLGEKNGLDLCRDLRRVAEQRGRKLPVWLMSGSDDRDFSAEALEAGALGFFRKPFSPLEIARRLGEIFPK
jgi:two-component system, response regulator, stage 0 sporulation protein F